MNRFYHAFNSRYNIYYNGKTSFDEQLKALNDGYKETYTDQILMYPISAQPNDKQTPGGPFDRAIEKGNKAIKLHSIQTKPDKKPGWRNDPKQVAWQEQEEYNPFLKHCWLLVGQGQFYNADFLQAAATFSYIARHYKQDEEMVAEARLWQARCYSEMDWLYEAEDILGKLNHNGIPKKNLKQYAAVNADFLIKEQKFEEAVPYLKTAIKAEKNRRQRTRMKYLLGQIYTDLELNDLAYKTFGEVARANPPYELEFAARIRQTEVFSGADYRKVVKMLERMGKSQKNKDYQDQVYYALGNLYLSQEDTVQAIKNYETGVAKSTLGGMDKAILWIKLGDLYFNMRDYIKAQPCFSGALAILQKDYHDYERVSKLSAVLDELVVHAEAVHLQDSLQVLSKMPEAERLAAIDKIIENVIREEEEAKKDAEKEAYLAQQEALGTGIDRPDMEIKTPTIPTGDASSFYFYNPQTVAQGKTQFQRRWGRRTLEDNWRRRNKKMSTFLEDGGQAATGETPQEAPADSLAMETDSLGVDEATSDDPKTREYYLQQIPFTEEEIEASNLIIIDALFNMAMIYKDKLNDLPLSIQAFEDLERRFPENEHRLESYYQIYLMSLKMKDTALSARYKDKLMTAFPESDYAVAVADPNYEYNIRMMDTVQDSIYQATYNSYLASDTGMVRRNFRSVGEKYPLATLLPKFMFLNALTYVQAGDAEGFKEVLKALIEKYPKADVTELAGEMLKGVLRGRALVQGDIRGMVWNLQFGGEKELSAADSARTFTAEKNGPHRMILVYPTGSIDKNQLLFVVAAYNFSNFMVKEFDLVQEENGPLSMLTISGFINFDEIAQYYKLIYGKNGYGASLSGDIAVIPISDGNYEVLMLGKTLDEYIRFFEEHFGQDEPEIAARLKTRMTEAQEEEEEEEEPEEEPEEEKPATVEPVTADTAAVAMPDTVRVVMPDTVAVEKTDTVPAVKADTIRTEEIQQPPAEREELSLKEIQEMRQREAEEQAAREEQERLDKEALLKKQKEEEEAMLKAKAEQEKQREQEQKDKAKQADADRKARLKARQELQKQKEREYKERQKQREQERKAKEREYKQKLKEKEKARKEAQKQKEASRKR